MPIPIRGPKKTLPQSCDLCDEQASEVVRCFVFEPSDELVLRWLCLCPECCGDMRKAARLFEDDRTKMN